MIDIIFIPIQFPPNSLSPKRIIDKLDEAILAGQIIIVPAGNYGPLVNTISSLAKHESLISVGATDEDGIFLADFSSRAVPLGNFCPTIVAPGINRITISHSGITKFKKDKKIKADSITRMEVAKQFGRLVSDEELLHIRANANILSGTSMAAECVAHLVAKLLEIRKKYALENNQAIIKRILQDMARPVVGKEQFEVGGGFVDTFILDGYLRYISLGNFPTKNSRELWPVKISHHNLTGKGVRLAQLDNTIYDSIDFTTM